MKINVIDEIAFAVEGGEQETQDTVERSTATSDYFDSLERTNVQEEQQNTDEEQADSTEDVPDEGYLIDGEIFTPEQIKEWKQGYLRQSDYTKKTQELSQERARVKDAIELYEYLQGNPELAQQLATQDKSVQSKAPTQDNKAIQELSYRLATMELDNQLNNIKTKDSTVDEVQLLNIATQNNCSLDVAYNIYRGMNFDKLLEQKLKEHSSKLTEEIKQNGISTKSIISSGDKPNNDGNFGLSNDEIIMAGKLGMSLEEYSKWK